MKKKIIALCLIVALAATAVIGGTLAYFTDTKDVTNTFTMGNVEITLTEPNWVATGSQDAPEVYPGEPLDKDPTVTNVGANHCFVRIKVTGLDQFGNKGAIQYRDAGYHVGQLNDGWVEYDGYFYWSKPLVAEGTQNESYNLGLTYKTAPLFSSIVMPTGLTGEEEVKPIVVYAQAVQAQGAKNPNWAAVKGMTVEEIAAWFTTCGMGDPVPATPGA